MPGGPLGLRWRPCPQGHLSLDSAGAMRSTLPSSPSVILHGRLLDAAQESVQVVHAWGFGQDRVVGAGSGSVR